MKSAVWTIARQELVLSRRNRWVLSFSVLFAGLTLLIAYFGMVTSGYSGFQDFIRTSASIVNLTGFLVPLFALLLGVFSFLSQREYLEILATTVPRAQVMIGKYLGLVLSVVGASVLGFGLPGVVISLTIGTEGALSYLFVVFYACLLAVVFVGLSILISMVTRQSQIAIGVALGVWIFFELLYGVLMLASTLYLSSQILGVTLLAGLFGNPIDLARVLSLLQVGGPHLFGPAGATLLKLTGSTFFASVLGVTGLLVWLAVPPALSVMIFRRQDL